jgi:hypothetical protein
MINYADIIVIAHKHRDILEVSFSSAIKHYLHDLIGRSMGISE